MVILLVTITAYYINNKPIKITDPTLLRIKEEGKIIVGLDATYPPMEYTDKNGNVIGFDADIAKEIASDMGVSAELKIIAWKDIFSELENRKIDMIISSVTITPERAKDMAFSNPYFNAGQTIVLLEDNQNIKSPTDLKDKIVGVQNGTTSEIEALKYTDPSLVIRYEDYEPTTGDLKAGKIDAIIIDYPAGVGLTRKTTGLKILHQPFTQEFYGVVVQKADNALLAEINKVIRNLKETGKLREIETKWL